MLSHHRVRAAAGLVAVAVTAAVFAPATGAGAAADKPITPFTTNSIVIQKSIGGITLNSPAKKAKKGFPKKDCTQGGCYYTAPNSSYTVYFVLASHTPTSKPFVGQIVFNSSRTSKTPTTRLRTTKGIGIGSSVHDLKAAYPKVNGDAATGFYVGSGQHQTHFYVTGRRINSIEMNSIQIG